MMEYTESPEGQYDNMLAQEDHRAEIEMQEENDRKLSRYPEAIALLREYETVFGCTEDAAFAGKVRAFLATEPAERREGGAG